MSSKILSAQETPTSYDYVVHLDVDKWVTIIDEPAIAAKDDELDEDGNIIAYGVEAKDAVTHDEPDPEWVMRWSFGKTPPRTMPKSDKDERTNPLEWDNSAVIENTIKELKLLVSDELNRRSAPAEEPKTLAAEGTVF